MSIFSNALNGGNLSGMDIYEIRKRNLRTLIGKQKKASCAARWEMSPAHLSQVLSDKTPKNLGDEVARRIERLEGLNSGWFDSLQGDAPRQAQPEDPGHSGLKEMRLWDEGTPVDTDEISVPYLREVELAAGSGRFVIEEGEKSSLRFDKRSLRQNGVQFDKARCVTVRGNSMLPVLRDGAIVGVNIASTGLAEVVDGDLYAINHNGQLRVKQLYRLPTGMRMRSFNRDEHPDEDYSYQQLQDEQISILGHVFWWGMYAR
ncbi:S24 family peptidase [Pseudomonas proteolytica]|uniref:S24 family peptidase n=1 Tax=Pseudomonas proteolytica TaxID=219574 RepID=UPI003B8A6CFB